MRIALFDFWTANEDRNANNANMMYDVAKGLLFSIDYGCIFNTATFDYPLSQLTYTDTILWSDIFRHLVQNQRTETIYTIIKRLKEEYAQIIIKCNFITNQLCEDIPQEWNVPKPIIKEKLHQLFDEQWITKTWNNFTEFLNENINYESIKI